MQERVKPASKPKSKKKVTLAIDAALAADASAQGLDLASVLEQALQARLHVKGPRGLTDEELEGLKWSERYVAEHGPWWDDSEKP